MTRYTVTPKFKTPDGVEHNSAKEADAHYKFITRKAAIEKALAENGYDLSTTTTVGAAAEFVAKFGDAFLAALTVPSNRGPKKGSTKTPATATATA